jgi:hypothetical protein
MVGLALGLGAASFVAADVQRIAPGTGTQDAVVIDTGANGLCETTAARGDIQAAGVGAGTPNLSEIRCAANQVAESVAVGDDVQVIAVGGACRNPNNVIVDTGPNGVAETPLAGDDVYLAGMALGRPPANTPCVITGADGVAQTSGPAGDDGQLLLAGQAEPNSGAVRCGPNAVADTTANNFEAGDDVQVVARGTACTTNDVVVDTGPDGVASTRAEGPDLHIAIAKPLTLTIRKGREEASRLVKVTVANVEFGANAPASRAFRIRAARGSCPGGTVTQLDANAKEPGLQATASVKLGKRAKASFLVGMRLDQVTNVARQVPFRCTFTVSAVAVDTDPDLDDAANDENNTTTVHLEVTDQNDL